MAYTDLDKRRKFFRDRYKTNTEWMRNYKVEQGCADCGYDSHHAGLEFDHIMPRLRGTVANQMGKSLNVIQEEIARCEVVCATCHSIRTWKRRQNNTLECKESSN